MSAFYNQLLIVSKSLSCWLSSSPRLELAENDQISETEIKSINYAPSHTFSVDQW